MLKSRSRPKRSRPITKVRWMLMHRELWNTADGSYDWREIVKHMKADGLVAATTDPMHIPVDSYVAEARRMARVGAKTQG